MPHFRLKIIKPEKKQMIYLQFISFFTNFAPRKSHLTLYRESLTSDSEPRSSVLTNLPTFKDIIKDVLFFLLQSTIFLFHILHFCKVSNFPSIIWQSSQIILFFLWFHTLTPITHFTNIGISPSKMRFCIGLYNLSLGPGPVIGLTNDCNWRSHPICKNTTY